MRLDPAEIADLPLPAALIDRRRAVISRTAEWLGSGPGTVSYHAGQAWLLVGSDRPARPELEVVTRMLLDEIRAAAAVLSGDASICASVLAGGLSLVAGWPVDEVPAAAGQVLERTRALIQARVPEVRIDVRFDGDPNEPVAGPDQVALALLQLAANAAAHDAATELRLGFDTGPTFTVEWPARGPLTEVPAGQSHSALRKRWGLGYVRLVADSLGATALPPASTTDGWTASCISLGTRRLTLPLAMFSGARPTRSTQTWEQTVRSHDPAVPGAIRADLGPVLAAAESQPGVLKRHGLLAARAARAGTWVALPPETGPERSREALRGLDHERALWAAPEPHATRVHGLITLLSRSLGDPPVAYAPEAFIRELPRACGALSVPAPEVGGLLACPDPRATAFLLAELGGELIGRLDGTYLVPGLRGAGSPFLALLGPDERGWCRLTPPMPPTPALSVAK
jgi:hypothetical protein